MKTPRLALLALALPALLLAPAANAALPNWPTVDESFRAWPIVYFKVGNDNRQLRCKYSECNPEKNKAQSNLYVMTQVGERVPIKSTVVELHPLGKWDPRRLTGQEYSQVTRVVDAHRTNYATQLSNFKLDNTGGKLTVVQGTNKYPASTDINTTYISETGGKIAVAAPAKMADDVIKPGTTVPPTTGGPGTAKPPTWWCDPKTGKVDSRPAGQAGPTGWTRLESQSSVCKKADGTAPTPVVVAPVISITPKEAKWLTKRQAKDLEQELSSLPANGETRAAALKGVVEKTRALIVENLKPNATAGTAYAAAIVGKSTAAIDGALPDVLWGGTVTSVVASSGTNLEIQLSPAEYAVLKSSNNAAALRAYTDARQGADGLDETGEKPAFSLSRYDPIALHLAAEAARKAVGPATSPVVTPQPGGEWAGRLLNDEDKKFLTPEELATYTSIFNSAPAPKEKDKNLQAEADRLLALIDKEKRRDDPKYAVPADRAAFDKLPEWQRRKFCSERRASTASLAPDARGAELGGSGNANGQLKQTADRSATGGTATTSSADTTGWAADACKQYTGSPVTTHPGGGTPSVGATVPAPPGVDKENEAKKKSEWLTQDLLTSAAKGAMVGLLVGSLFGPVGLIAGPLLGGALFYGLTKITG